MNDPTTASRRRLRSRHDREIAALAAPALGALIAEPLYVLADTAVVGHLGTPQLAGLAVASSVLLTLYAVFIFLAYGTTAAGAGSGGVLGLGEARELADLAFKEPQQRPRAAVKLRATQPRACARGRRRTAPRCPALGSGPVASQGPNTIRGLDQPAGRIWSTAESSACWV
jgi:hypothetical protein